MPNVNHRIAFNCDLFLTIEAPADATSEELERRVLERLKAHGGVRPKPGFGFEVPFIRGRIYPRWQELDSDSDEEQLENFTIENVGEVGHGKTK